jgi:putative intracellular protease/amidase
MNGGLHVVPTYTFADITSGAARKPDLVVVPAVNDPTGEQESELRNWIVQQAHTGARILSVCAGSRVLAATGLLDGRGATSHWSHIAPLQKSNPRVNWVQGQRYVENGTITTSTGVSPGIPASLHLVQELAGTTEPAPRSPPGSGTRVGRQAVLPQSPSSTSPPMTQALDSTPFCPGSSPPWRSRSPTVSERSTLRPSSTSTATPRPRA